MFITNDTAKNDPVMQIAMQSYMKRLQREEAERNAIRAGLIKPQPTQVWNISDHD